jgi:glutathione S-transferase
MTMKFYGHPLSSYCWKALIALYVVDEPFEFETLNLGDPEVRARFARLSPMGKMPALVDGDAVLSEASVVVEHLAWKHPRAGLLPADPRAALEVRFWDRQFDNYCHSPMQRLVGLKLRPAGNDDQFGVNQLYADLRQFYGVAEAQLAKAGPFITGEWFTLADCAAAPALHYAAKICPLTETRPRLAAYLARLEALPSVARVLKEAEPFAHFYPGAPAETQPD